MDEVKEHVPGPDELSSILYGNQRAKSKERISLGLLEL